LLVSDLPTHDAEFVHELRKTIKRMRALARLLRIQLGKAAFEAANDSLRDAGRRLAAERDAQIRLATLERLRMRHPKALDRQGIDRLRELLSAERDRGRGHTEDRTLLADIRAMRATLRDWRAFELEPAALERSLRRIYKQGRRRYKEAHRGKPDSRELHDWRKRVKSLTYALEASGGSRAAMHDLRRTAKRLGDVLGEEHDLWMLTTYLDERADAFEGDEDAHQELLARIDRRREGLRKRAMKLGRQVYELSPEGLLELLTS
jgi:CHAD domain-containing protein